MAVLKTKNKIVEVARHLFATKGLEDTTMKDIAEASGIGRRTIYTYFKNREELYWAVIGTELDMLAKKMKAVAIKNIPPAEKIMTLIYTQINSIRDVIIRNGSLKADFFKNTFMVEVVRRKFDQRALKSYETVLKEGKDKGVFHFDDVATVSQIIMFCVKGIEVPYMRNNLKSKLDPEAMNRCVRSIVLNALQVDKTNI